MLLCVLRVKRSGSTLMWKLFSGFVKINNYEVLKQNMFNNDVIKKVITNINLIRQQNL